jgi:hypothetical protein
LPVRRFFATATLTHVSKPEELDTLKHMAEFTVHGSPCTILAEITGEQYDELKPFDCDDAVFDIYVTYTINHLGIIDARLVSAKRVVAEEVLP